MEEDFLDTATNAGKQRLVHYLGPCSAILLMTELVNVIYGRESVATCWLPRLLFCLYIEV